jgi:uncharacterized membrane protein YfcA
MDLLDVALVPLGAVIGFLVAALGAGGSLLTLPVLVGLVGLSPYAATTASLFITGSTAATGLVAPARSGRVAWVAGLSLAALGIPAAWLGAQWAASAPPAALLAVFGVVVGIAALALALRRPGQELGDELTARVLRCPALSWCRAVRVVRWVAIGLVVGLLTGVLGVGGGFLVVPALVLLVGMPVHRAVGTSLLVVTVNSVVGLLARAGTPLDWAVVLPLSIGGVLGALAGSRWAARIPAHRLQQVLTGVLVLVAGWAITRAALA